MIVSSHWGVMAPCILAVYSSNQVMQFFPWRKLQSMQRSISVEKRAETPYAGARPKSATILLVSDRLSLGTRRIRLHVHHLKANAE